MRTLRSGLWAVIAFAVIPRVVCAQDAKPTVAVLHFNASSIGKDVSAVGDALMDMATTEFASKQNLRLIDRGDVEDLLTKQKLLVSGRLSDEAAQRAGKLLGAQYIVYGSVFVERDVARLDMRIVDPETGEILHTLKDKAPQDNLTGLVERATNEFTADLKLKNKTLVAEAVVPAPAVLAYSRGLDFEKRGKKTQAAQMYEKTLQISPSYEDAQKALARVK